MEVYMKKTKKTKNQKNKKSKNQKNKKSKKQKIKKNKKIKKTKKQKIKKTKNQKNKKTKVLFSSPQIKWSVCHVPLGAPNQKTKNQKNKKSKKQKNKSFVLFTSDKVECVSCPFRGSIQSLASHMLTLLILTLLPGRHSLSMINTWDDSELTYTDFTQSTFKTR